MISPNRRHGRQFFYKYMTASTAKICLVNKSLRLSSPLILNDPFDVARVLRLSFTSEAMSRKLVSELADLIRGKASPEETQNQRLRILLRDCMVLSDEQREYLARTLQKQIVDTNYDQLPSFRELQKTWEAMIPKTRILSLTEDANNTVMWSSYADSYKGVVIQMECIDIYDSVLLLAEQVIYTDELPTMGTIEYWIKMITGQASLNYNAIFRSLELTKSTRWYYEKEWRVISFEKNSTELYSDYKVRPETFRKIYFGKDISDNDKSDLLSLLTQDLSHMKAYKMHIDHQNGKVVFPRIKST